MDYTQEQYEGFKEDYEEFLSKYNDLKAYTQSIRDNVPSDLDSVLEEVLSYWEYYTAECKKSGFKQEIYPDDLATMTDRYETVLDTSAIHVLRANPNWDYRYELRALDTVYYNLVDKYEMFLKYNKVSEGE